MGFFPLFKRSSGPRRVFVISLDGVPHSFLARHIPEGAFPNLARLFADGDLRRMATVQPPVSSVVWASYATGMNPGRHGVYGLVERRPELLRHLPARLPRPGRADPVGRARERRQVDHRRERPRHLAAAPRPRRADRSGSSRDPRGDRLPAHPRRVFARHRLPPRRRHPFGPGGEQGRPAGRPGPGAAQALRGGLLPAASRAVGLLPAPHQRNRPHQPFLLGGLRARHAGVRARLPLLLPHGSTR